MKLKFNVTKRFEEWILMFSSYVSHAFNAIIMIIHIYLTSNERFYIIIMIFMINMSMIYLHKLNLSLISIIFDRMEVKLARNFSSGYFLWINNEFLGDFKRKCLLKFNLKRLWVKFPPFILLVNTFSTVFRFIINF